MLGESLELNGSSGNDVFDVPRSEVVRISAIQLIQQVSERHGKSTSCSQGVPIIDVVLVAIEEEVLNEGFSVGETLDDAVHEARVAQVLKANETISASPAKPLVQGVLHQLLLRHF